MLLVAGAIRKSTQYLRLENVVSELESSGVPDGTQQGRFMQRLVEGRFMQRLVENPL